LACSADQDQFIWPLQLLNMTPSKEDVDRSRQSFEAPTQREYALIDYVNPDGDPDQHEGQ
jgi:hypothetical protein